MPAFSYKERFVPYVLDGSKPHTIRARRKNFTKKGDMMYHYFGLRTRHCRKLAEDVCLDAKSIYIDRNQVIVYDGLLDDEALAAAKVSPRLRILGTHIVLSKEEMDRLAWFDGFRPEGSGVNKCAGCFDYMISFWESTHSLPFTGDIIYRTLPKHEYLFLYWLNNKREKADLRSWPILADDLDSACNIFLKLSINNKGWVLHGDVVVDGGSRVQILDKPGLERFIL